MRMIDADALKLAICRDQCEKDGCDYTCSEIAYVVNAPTVGGWISVKDRLPENAKHPGAFCPRYLVRTKYGVSEGWYNPDKGCWYTLVWFLIGRFDEDDIDMDGGDIPRVSKMIEVTHWTTFPESPEVDE